MKNPRRLNDVLKLTGWPAGLMVLIGPVLMMPHASFVDLLKACALAILGGFLTFLSGLGTRGPGTEYTEVAEAKVKASLVPPPLTVAPPAEPPQQ